MDHCPDVLKIDLLSSSSIALTIKARIVANETKKSDAAPDFRVYAGRAELGAAWE